MQDVVAQISTHILAVVATAFTALVTVKLKKAKASVPTGSLDTLMHPVRSRRMDTTSQNDNIGVIYKTRKYDVVVATCSGSIRVDGHTVTINSDIRRVTLEGVLSTIANNHVVNMGDSIGVVIHTENDEGRLKYSIEDLKKVD